MIPASGQRHEKLNRHQAGVAAVQQAEQHQPAGAKKAAGPEPALPQEGEGMFFQEVIYKKADQEHHDLEQETMDAVEVPDLVGMPG